MVMWPIDQGDEPGRPIDRVDISTHFLHICHLVLSPVRWDGWTGLVQDCIRPINWFQYIYFGIIYISIFHSIIYTSVTTIPDFRSHLKSPPPSGACPFGNKQNSVDRHGLLTWICHPSRSGVCSSVEPFPNSIVPSSLLLNFIQSTPTVARETVDTVPEIKAHLVSHMQGHQALGRVSVVSNVSSTRKL
jgi:hypothetical protein